MKPEELDKLFKNKLQNHRLEPSADLWAQLQSRMQPEETKKERKPMWLWYAAASVSILLLSVALWLGYDRNQAGTAGMVASGQQPQTETAPATVPAPEVAVPEAEMLAVQTAPAPQPDKPENEAKSEKRLKNAPVTAPAVKQQLARRQEAVKKETPAPAEMLAEHTAKPTVPEQNQHYAAQEQPVPPVPVEVLVIKGSETPAAFASQNPEEIAAAQPRRPFFQRVLRQAVNLTQGEEVNLNDLKINRQIAFETQIGNQKMTKVINL